MQIVIDIPEEEYKCVQITGHIGNTTQVSNAIFDGIPLPKGHGRILDEKDILDVEKNGGLIYDLVDMPDYIADVNAIIEADKEGS